MLGESGQDGVRGGRDHHGERRDKQPIEQSDGGVGVQTAAEGHLLFGGEKKGIGLSDGRGREICENALI